MEPRNIDVICKEIRTSDQCRVISAVLSRIGDKWSVLVVLQLRNGSQRFSELKRALGSISQRMLTFTLRGLERDGLVSRHITPASPPRVDYELTGLGHSLRPAVERLGQWAFENSKAIIQSQENFDRS